MTFDEFKALSPEERTALVNKVGEASSAARSVLDHALEKLLRLTAEVETLWAWREALRSSSGEQQ